MQHPASNHMKVFYPTSQHNHEQAPTWVCHEAKIFVWLPFRMSALSWQRNLPFQGERISPVPRRNCRFETELPVFDAALKIGRLLSLIPCIMIFMHSCLSPYDDDGL